MSYSIDAIRTLLAVAQQGSISAAAQRLGVTKSVVSQRVRQLEDALGAELLHRSSRGVRPTERGSSFVQEAGEALARLDEAVQRVHGIDGPLIGGMRVSAPVSFGACYLGPALFGFLQQHPKLDVALDYNDRQVDLSREGYDLAIRITRLAADTALVARALCLSRRIVCASPDYLQQHGAPQDPADLAAHELIGYAYPVPGLWRFEGDGGAAVPGDRGRIRANNGDAMRDAAVAGLGIAPLPLFIVADDLRAGRLQACLPAHRLVPDIVYAVYPHRRHPMPQVARLVAHLQQALAGTPPWEQGLPPGLRTHAVFADDERDVLQS